MLDSDTNLVEQLAEAMKHHQSNIDAAKEAEKKLALMRQLAAQIEQMQDAKSEK